VFVLEVERNALVRYTKSEVGPVDPLQFVAAELIRFPTFDRDRGKTGRSRVRVPPRTPGPASGATSTSTAARIAVRPSFSPFAQFLVRELGFTVIAPNVRGSTGYGKTF
jgi:hypothetical protein